MKRKTSFDYEKDINAIQKQLRGTPKDKKLHKKLLSKVAAWTKRVDVRVHIAKNEQLPWTAEMLGYPTVPMDTKNVSGFDQVGDYIASVETSHGEVYIDIVIERKSVGDLYGTLVAEDARARFYREIDRFVVDDRFTKMFILVESTFSEFLMYQPSFDADGFNYSRMFDNDKNAAINKKKMTVVADMFAIGIPVVFCDSVTLSGQLCGNIFREAIRKEYYKLLPNFSNGV